MKAEIICVGTELLQGNVVNTNAAFISQRLSALGIQVLYQSVVGDDVQILSTSLKAAMKRSDLIILSGGLGPTKDDLTKETVAKVCGCTLVDDPVSHAVIENFFEQRGMTPTENNWKQCKILSGSRALPNRNGLAPGILYEKGDTTVVLLPGPPEEMKAVFTDGVEPYLIEKSDEAIFIQTIKICGMGESRVETEIMDLVSNTDKLIVATYAKLGEVHIRVTGRGESMKEAKKLVKPLVKEIKVRFGEYIYTTEESVTLEQAVADLLIANKLTVSCAESCTGGLLSARLINVPGISEVYKHGFITYSNKSKRRLLGLKKQLLEKHGAVSAQAAEAMADGLSLLAKSDVAVGVTGYAGPDAEPGKPIGLVYIACRVKDKTKVREYHFNGDRAKIRSAAVTAALVLMRECVLEYFSEITFGGDNL